MKAILVSGVPGAGKTTVARLLADRFSRSVHIEGDLVGHHFIVKGLIPPQGPPHEEAQRQLRLRRRNVCLLADSFAGAGFIPIIDDTVTSTDVLDEYRLHLRTRPFLLVVLAPSVETVRNRDAARDKQVFHIWGHLDPILRKNMHGIGLRVDSTSLDAQATVDAIMRNLDQALINGDT